MDQMIQLFPDYYSHTAVALVCPTETRALFIFPAELQTSHLLPKLGKIDCVSVFSGWFFHAA